MFTLYGIKSCDNCRKARKYLTEKAIEFRFHDVRENGLDVAMLQRWASRSEWETLLNRKSLTWRKIPEVDRSGLNEERAFALIIDQPTLLKRPILESEESVVVGFSKQRFDELIGQESREPPGTGQ